MSDAIALEALLDAARTETDGLDFQDSSFVPALRRVLEIPADLKLSGNGLANLRVNLVRCLVNRLRYERDVAQHPEILEEDVSDPIVAIGLPRSGTTKLQRVLSSIAGVQVTNGWRMLNPAPLPGEKNGDPRPRIAWAEAAMGVASGTRRDYNRVHEFEIVGAEESGFIPVGNFDYVMQAIPLPSESYLRWARTVDRRSPLSYMKRMLQYMQWQDGGSRGRPWVIKNPGHTGEIAEMLEVFPRATFVITERDIFTTMASAMQMTWEFRQTSMQEMDRYEVGCSCVEYWSYELHRYLAQRLALGDRVSVVEVPYRRLVADAVGVVREVCDAHELTFGQPDEDAILAWERNNPQNKFGRFHYDLADFGWTADQVAKSFVGVVERWRGS